MFMIYLDRPQPLRTWELFYSQLLVLNSQLRTTQNRLVLDSSTRSERTPYDDHRHYQHAPRTLKHTGHTLRVSEAAGPQQAGALRPGARAEHTYLRPRPHTVKRAREGWAAAQPRQGVRCCKRACGEAVAWWQRTMAGHGRAQAWTAARDHVLDPSTMD